MRKIANCRFCGISYQKKTAQHKYCSTTCRVKDWRKRNGIPNPDFKNMGVYKIGLGDKIEADIMLTKEKIYKINQKLTELNTYRNEHQLFINNFNYNKFKNINSYWNYNKVFELYNKEHSSYIHSINQKVSKAKISAWNELNSSKEKLGKDLSPYIPNILNHSHNIINAEISYLTEEKNILLEFIKTNNSLKDNKFELKDYKGAVVQTLTSLGDNNKEIMITTIDGLDKITNKNTINFQNPKFKKVFGKIPPNFSLGLWGDAGSGKTTIALKILDELEKYGSCLFITAEHSISPNSSLHNITKKAKVAKEIKIAQISDTESIHKLLNADFQFIAIDSVSRLNMKPNELLNIRNIGKDKGIIFILESTKDGVSFKGDNHYKHYIECFNQVKRNEFEIAIINEKNQYSEQHITVKFPIEN